MAAGTVGDTGHGVAEIGLLTPCQYAPRARYGEFTHRGMTPSVGVRHRRRSGRAPRGHRPGSPQRRVDHRRSRLLATDGRPLPVENITINAICPGPVDTPLIDGVREPLEQRGFPIIDPSGVADANLGRLTDEESGRAVAVRTERESSSSRFARHCVPVGAGTQM